MKTINGSVATKQQSKVLTQRRLHSGLDTNAIKRECRRHERHVMRMEMVNDSTAAEVAQGIETFKATALEAKAALHCNIVASDPRKNASAQIIPGIAFCQRSAKSGQIIPFPTNVLVLRKRRDQQHGRTVVDKMLLAA